MATVTMNGVEQVLSRKVKPDGRCGGLQHFIGTTVDIIVYEKNEVE